MKNYEKQRSRKCTLFPLLLFSLVFVIYLVFCAILIAYMIFNNFIGFGLLFVRFCFFAEIVF